MAKSFTERMMGAAMLDVPTYEEVEADESATGQAAIVVVLAAIAAGIGAIGGEGSGVIGSIIGSLIGWALGAGVIYLVGTKLFGGTATWGEVLRTMGFAQSPGILRFLGFIPVLGGIIAIVVALWTLVTSIVAIRQALDVSTGKAVVVAIVAWLVMIIPIMVFGLGAAVMGGALGR